MAWNFKRAAAGVVSKTKAGSTNTLSFVAMHFKGQKSLTDGKNRATRAFTFIGIAGAIVSAATSLNFTVPTTYDVVASWELGGALTQWITAFLVVMFAYLIEGGMTVLFPFGVNMVGAVIATSTVWAMNKNKGTRLFANWIGIGNFLLKIFRFDPRAITAVAILLLASAQAFMSIYFSWNGNEWKAADIASTLLPTTSKAETLATLDSVRHAREEQTRNRYSAEIKQAEKEAKRKTKEAIVLARKYAAEQKAILMERLGKDLAKGNEWARGQFIAGRAQISADSLSMVNSAKPETARETLKAKMASELAADSASISSIAAAASGEADASALRYEQKRAATALLWKWLGVISTLVFVACTIIVAFMKNIDFQALENAAMAAAAANNVDFNRNQPHGHGKFTRTNRNYNGKTVGEIGSDIRDAFNRMNEADMKGNDNSVKTNARNFMKFWEELCNHPDIEQDPKGNEVLNGYLARLKTKASTEGWKIHDLSLIDSLAN